MTAQTWLKRLHPYGNGGKSAYITIPKALMDENGVKAGDEVILSRGGTGKVIVDLEGESK